MTFRARPDAPRSRSDHDRGDRRNALLNVGFAFVVVAALLLLAIAAGLTWYNQHIAPAATVGGVDISRDALTSQRAVDALRIELAERAIRTRRLEGTIRDVDARTQLSVLDQQASNIDAIALEHLIDARIQAGLAAKEGVQVGDADIDAKFREEASTPELRHVWVIEVEPELDDNADKPTDAQKAAAKQKADKALADLQGGTSWDQVAKDVSTGETKDQGGDLGFIDDTTSGLDAPWVEAVFAADLDTPTAVVEGNDGIYRIGRATQVVAEKVDAAFEQKIKDKGLSVAAFREALRADVVRDRLEKLIVDRVKQPGPQRQVQEIFQAPDDSESKTSALKTKHILYAPNDGDSSAEVPADDPAWAEAEKDARAAYERIKANPDLFDQIAREEGDDGTAAQGGKLPYFAPEDAANGELDQDFADAIFKAGIEPGQLLEPVKSAFGWHVILIWHRPTDLEWAETLKTQLDGGADFAKLARDNSESDDAETGGDMGWIAKGQLPELLDLKIFGTPVGEVSDPLLVPDTEVTAADAGVYLFKVLKEEVRAPEGEQLAELERTAFSTWYTEQKLRVNIQRHLDATDPLS
jgi:parvulin-like peptidyl-prolyl isomerase